MDEQVVEIHRIERMEFAVVACINRSDDSLVVLRRGPAVVFGFADQVFCQPGVEFFILRYDAINDFFDEPELVALVENGEVVFVSDLVGIGAENPHAEGMECGCRDFVRLLLVEHSPDALLHFAGGFVGEGHGQNFGRRGSRRDQPCNAGHDGAGFSGSCAGEYEQWAVLVGGRALLFGIEVVETEAAHGNSRRAKRARTSG